MPPQPLQLYSYSRLCRWFHGCTIRKFPMAAKKLAVAYRRAVGYFKGRIFRDVRGQHFPYFKVGKRHVREVFTVFYVPFGFYSVPFSGVSRIFGLKRGNMAEKTQSLTCALCVRHPNVSGKSYMFT